MWVAAVWPMPSTLGFQLRPPSSLITTPPPKFFTPRARHILGRGRSWVLLITAQMRPFTSGSKTAQYAVFTHSRGMPRLVASFQADPLLKLSNRRSEERRGGEE